MKRPLDSFLFFVASLACACGPGTMVYDAGADGGGRACATPPSACVVPVHVDNAVAPFTTTAGGPLHPRGFVGDPDVLYEDGRWRMWFTASRVDLDCVGEWYECLVQGTAYAESADGRAWDDQWLAPGDPRALTQLVMEPTPGGWDEHGVETVAVLRAHDGRLRMYYTGHRIVGTAERPSWDAIGVAYSDDGITWTKEAEPVFVPELPWERVCCDAGCDCVWGGVLEPSVTYAEDQRLYHMWYSAFGERDGLVTYRIGHATSEDGLTWMREAEPVFAPAAGAWDSHVTSHSEVIRDPCSGWHLFYHAFGAREQSICDASPIGCVGYTPGSIGHAVSSDGVTWEHPDMPVLTPREGSWDGFFVGGPAGVFVEGTLNLVYFGNRDNESANRFDSAIGAVSLCTGA